MQEISGYNLDVIERFFVNRLPSCTAQAINAKLLQVDETIGSTTGDIFISIGENCGAGFQMRNAGVATLGSNFFDNTVIRVDNLPHIIRSEFRDMLSLRNLTIGNWETHDSVFDELYQLFFHHYFMPGGGIEKHYSDTGSRRIDAQDIPLFLPIVRGQFEYLAAKFFKIARSDLKKYYVIRNVEGRALPEEALDEVSKALVDAGAVNFSLIQVVTYFDGPQVSTRYGHWNIAEVAERWGDKADWLACSQGRGRGETWD